MERRRNLNEFTAREPANVVVSMTGSRSEIVHRPLPQDDAVQRQPYISLAKAKRGWAPTVMLKQGLAPTIEHFERELSGNG